MSLTKYANSGLLPVFYFIIYYKLLLELQSIILAIISIPIILSTSLIGVNLYMKYDMAIWTKFTSLAYICAILGVFMLYYKSSYYSVYLSILCVLIIGTYLGYTAQKRFVNKEQFFQLNRHS